MPQKGTWTFLLTNTLSCLFFSSHTVPPALNQEVVQLLQNYNSVSETMPRSAEELYGAAVRSSVRSQCICPTALLLRCSLIMGSIRPAYLTSPRLTWAVDSG